MIQGTDQQDHIIQRKPKSALRRYMPSAVGIVAAIMFVILIFQSFGKGANLVLDRDQLQFATVQRGDLIRDISVQGRIVAANAPTLYSQENGQVHLLKQPGEAVSEGDLLATITSPALQNDLQQQEAVLAGMRSDAERAELEARNQQLDMEQVMNTAQVNLMAAQRELQRARQSIELGVIRQLDVDIAEDNLMTSELAFDHAKRKVELAEDMLNFEQNSRAQTIHRQQLIVDELRRKVEELNVTAPVNGQLGTWLVEQQSHVIPGQPLLTVIDLSEYEAELLIQESHAQDLMPSQQVEIQLGNQQLRGSISYIAPEVRNNQVSARVRFTEVDNSQLRQNQRLTARVILEHKTDVLKIARGDFVSTGGGRQAYQVIDNQAVRKQVQLGALSVQWVEILDGAEEGEQWVISNLTEFNNQNRVNLN
ncbi:MULTISPECIES: efflux RND transporter periplasmic adaptor subunit [Gammaproteobacteria]|uniref:efflux RND transporter periplasmic adaptor subunit n=1 Tax=Gammaproteobacteria TaxID=1236 RepID=UPI000DD0E107|nr:MULTISPECIES: HlyD family efflux transporter periplasmic adaptor subunit [Gammaproteobacteria]RTE86715.1 HlyD family efflux transporter periplasmic adaptor subunit [Aliidiomarina sp. B3213]TCZ90731.1 HlyD family efflux transporter periplasmic adaptor subunit [Lysobacter sp. N42]